MEYKGKLYGKCGSMLIPLHNSTDDWDAMVKQISELKAKMAEDMEAFAEWCSKNKWYAFGQEEHMWYNYTKQITKTTSQLRELWEERGQNE